MVIISAEHTLFAVLSTQANVEAKKSNKRDKGLAVSVKGCFAHWSDLSFGWLIDALDGRIG